MKILIHNNKNSKLSPLLYKAKEGFLKHNIVSSDIDINTKKVDIHYIYKEIKKFDMCVTWGVRSNVFRTCNMIKKPCLVMERGYMGDRFYWTSCGFNGLNGEADFLNKEKNQDNSRWEKCFKDIVEVKDWKNSGSYALLNGQVLTDASLKGINVYKIYTEIIEELNKKNIPVIYRKHPKERKNREFKPYKKVYFDIDKNKNLEDSLKDSKFSIAINSNAGVVSILCGVPTISINKKSMVYDYSPHSLSEPLYFFDRKEWLNKLSFAQWSPEEIENGIMWDHLRNYIL
jgi:hypothetical protein